MNSNPDPGPQPVSPSTSAPHVPASSATVRQPIVGRTPWDAVAEAVDKILTVAGNNALWIVVGAAVIYGLVVLAGLLKDQQQTAFENMGKVQETAFANMGAAYRSSVEIQEKLGVVLKSQIESLGSANELNRTITTMTQKEAIDRANASAEQVKKESEAANTQRQLQYEKETLAKRLEEVSLQVETGRRELEKALVTQRTLEGTILSNQQELNRRAEELDRRSVDRETLRKDLETFASVVLEGESDDLRQRANDLLAEYGPAALLTRRSDALVRYSTDPSLLTNAFSGATEEALVAALGEAAKEKAFEFAIMTQLAAGADSSNPAGRALVVCSGRQGRVLADLAVFSLQSNRVTNVSYYSHAALFSLPSLFQPASSEYVFAWLDDERSTRPASVYRKLLGKPVTGTVADIFAVVRDKDYLIKKNLNIELVTIGVGMSEDDRMWTRYAPRPVQNYTETAERARSFVPPTAESFNQAPPEVRTAILGLLQACTRMDEPYLRANWQGDPLPSTVYHLRLLAYLGGGDLGITTITPRTGPLNEALVEVSLESSFADTDVMEAFSSGELEDHFGGPYSRYARFARDEYFAKVPLRITFARSGNALLVQRVDIFELVVQDNPRDRRSP